MSTPSQIFAHNYLKSSDLLRQGRSKLTPMFNVKLHADTEE